MEEAYCELYQQFICLRSLCLKQAAMLHRLTAAMEKQNGSLVSTVEFSDLMSIPFQCTNDLIASPPHETPHSNNNTTGKCELGLLFKNRVTLSEPVAQDMLKFNMSNQGREEEKVEQKQRFLSNPHTLIGHEEASCAGPDYSDEDRHALTTQVNVTHNRDLLCPSDREMMSDVVMQSHVCDFCQAFFPGDTTTRGEFLRHLNTHVS